MSACCYRWRGPRPDAHVAPVDHVCARELHHSADAVIAIHRCSCGAEHDAPWGES